MAVEMQRAAAVLANSERRSLEIQQCRDITRLVEINLRHRDGFVGFGRNDECRLAYCSASGGMPFPYTSRTVYCRPVSLKGICGLSGAERPIRY